MRRIKDWAFGLWFFLLTRCTQRWLGRVWRELIEKDIHPADTFALITDRERVELSAFGSQVHVVSFWYNRRVHEFTVNWIKDAGFYVHEKWAIPGKPNEMGDWSEVYRQRSRILRSSQWVGVMRRVSENLDQIEDRSEENMIGNGNS